MDYLQQLIKRYPSLESAKNEISAAFDIIVKSYEKEGKLLIAGNGGSASDAEHIAGELMKTFVKKRELPDSFITNVASVDEEIAQYLVPRLQPGLPAIALSGHASLNTACINDIDGNITFAQQVYCYRKEGDVLLAISTSGNSPIHFRLLGDSIELPHELLLIEICSDECVNDGTDSAYHVGGRAKT